MSAAVPGILHEGRVVLETPTDWPDGARVEVRLVEPVAKIGLSEEEWSDSPEAIAHWIRWYDSLQPLEMTPEEEADLATWRQRVKEYTIANMHKDIDRRSQGLLA
jgi:hypothetical protein